MELSNILLENLKGKALEQISKKVGGDKKSTKSIAAQALPLILAQLEKNSQDTKEAKKINEALNSHVWKSKIDIDDGMKILSHIFGKNTDNVIGKIAQASWQNKKQSAGVMSALSSVIMETLGDQKKAAGGFDTADLVKLLSGTGKDANILGMVMDQDGDWDFDKNDAMKFGLGWIQKNFFSKK